MSNYRRLISYIYAYEGGVKGKNIGFAKLEARNGQCKISVNVKKVYVGGNDLGVYLLSGKEEILLGKIFIRNGAGEFRTTVNVNNVDGRNCTMDQCYGLTVHDLESTWQSYTTIWEDAVAHAAEVELADVTAENRLEKELAENQPGIEKPKQVVSIRSVAKEIEAEFQSEDDQEIDQELHPYETMEAEKAQKPVPEPEVIKTENEVLESEEFDFYQPEAESAQPPGENAEDSIGIEITHQPADHESVDLEMKFQSSSNPGNQTHFTNTYYPGNGPANSSGNGNTYQNNMGNYPSGMDSRFNPENQIPGQTDSYGTIPTLESIYPDQSDFMPYITTPSQGEAYNSFQYTNCFSPGTTTDYHATRENGVQGRVPAGANANQPWGVQMKPDNPTDSYSSKISQFTAYRPTSDKSEQSFKSQPEPMKTPSGKTLSEAMKTVLEPLFSNSDKAENPAGNASLPLQRENKTVIKPKIINPESGTKNPLLGSPEELERLQKSEQEENSHQQIWNQFSKNYPKIQAFDYEKGCEILSIKPKDIGLLPRETWVFGNNSFLLHGYYNYRYLILAKLENPQGQPRYLLGVPGHYYSNEKYMASMFGFPNFVLSKNQPTEDGRFGYWYTDIRLSSQ